jgi:amino acid transporter
MTGEQDYDSGSLSLLSTVALGTGVMIGAGVFALTGQMAELTGALFPFAFISGAIIAAFQAYSYVKVASAYPSAGGIAMILKKAWGPGVVTAAASLMMALSMVINESLVARTFATYALRPFDLQEHTVAVPAVAVGVVAMTLGVNLLGNDVVGRVATISAAVKVFGILLFGGICPSRSPNRGGQRAAPPGRSSERQRSGSSRTRDSQRSPTAETRSSSPRRTSGVRSSCR